jgi:hypothetical protein
MTVIFAAPAATGKTKFGEELARFFGCRKVIEAENLDRMSVHVLKEQLPYALILCTEPSEVPDSPYIRDRRLLTRDEMNIAMIRAGGIPIWNDDGSVNTMGQRRGLQA